MYGGTDYGYQFSQISHTVRSGSTFLHGILFKIYAESVYVGVAVTGVKRKSVGYAVCSGGNYNDRIFSRLCQHVSVEGEGVRLGEGEVLYGVFSLHSDEEVLVRVGKYILVCTIVNTRVYVLNIVSVEFAVVEGKGSVVLAVVGKRIFIAEEIFVIAEKDNSAEAVLYDVEVGIVLSDRAYRAVHENYAVVAVDHGYRHLSVLYNIERDKSVRRTLRKVNTDSVAVSSYRTLSYRAITAARRDAERFCVDL